MQKCSTKGYHKSALFSKEKIYKRVKYPIIGALLSIYYTVEQNGIQAL